MDVIGYLIVLSAVGLAAAVMAVPAARRRAATTDSDTANKREAQVRDADLWGNCSPCRRVRAGHGSRFELGLSRVPV